MKTYHPPALSLLILLLSCVASMAAADMNIPAMTWTQRSDWNIRINDNQDFVAPEYYVESCYNDLHAAAKAGHAKHRVAAPGQ